MRSHCRSCPLKTADFLSTSSQNSMFNVTSTTISFVFSRRAIITMIWPWEIPNQACNSGPRTCREVTSISEGSFRMRHMSNRTAELSSPAFQPSSLPFLLVIILPFHSASSIRPIFYIIIFPAFWIHTMTTYELKSDASVAGRGGICTGEEKSTWEHDNAHLQKIGKKPVLKVSTMTAWVTNAASSDCWNCIL